MDDSQTRAITVALEHLELEMVPTDVLITDLVRHPSSGVLEIGTGRSFDHRDRGTRTDLTDLLEGLEPGDVVDVGVTRTEASRRSVELAGGTIPRAGP